MKDYITLIKELKRIMNTIKPTRYWGTLILIAVTSLMGVVLWHLPELITALNTVQK